LEEKKASILLCVAVIAFEVWAALYLKDNQAWYTSTMALPFGIMYAQYESTFDKFVRKNSRILLPVCLLIIVITYLISKKYEENYMVSNFILKNIGTIALIFVVLVILAHCSLVCRITLWLGKISMEIYLVHLIMLAPFRTAIQNDVVYAACVVFFTLILSVPLSFIVSKILKLHN